MATLPDHTIDKQTYEILQIWVERLTKEHLFYDYIEWLHNCIRNNHVHELTRYERNLLKVLFKRGIITSENLIDFVINFKHVKYNESLWTSFLWIFSQDLKTALKPDTTIRNKDTIESKEREDWFNARFEITTALNNFDFLKADSHFNQASNLIDHNSYYDLRTAAIKKYISESFTYKGKEISLDDEQVEAINTVGKSILVQARAGSGKTLVIAAKIMFLLEKQGVTPDQISVLAFNHDVPKEVRTRLCDGFVLLQEPGKYKDINVARTFHSLALKIVGGKLNILVDEGSKGGERSHFIKEIIVELQKNDLEFQRFFYDFYRGSSAVEDNIDLQNQYGYFEYIRNLSYQTLKGDTVKSFGEKVIADFLFEHGINYHYEYQFSTMDCRTQIKFINDKLKTLSHKILPDFYLPDFNLVWEHWAIDEDKNDQKTKDSFNQRFSITWDDYYKKKYLKQWFWGDWRNKNLDKTNKKLTQIISIRTLVETELKDLAHGRKAFEEHIEKLLTHYGVVLQQPNYEELSEQLWLKNKDKLTSLMIRFIDRYQQQAYPNKHEFVKQMERYRNDPWTYSFLRMGLKVLVKYEQKQSEAGNKIDFNQLVSLATDKIRRGDVDNIIKDLKWLLIDEYQDFSPLFFNLVNELRYRNHELNLFCVGDNWQAINGFAGADTRYFDDFSGYFHDGITTTISTNHRSSPQIVNVSNEFMHRYGFKGKAAIPFKLSPVGQVSIENIENVFVDLTTKLPISSIDEKIQKHIYDLQDKTQWLKAAQYLKRCLELLTENKGKHVLFLNTKNIFLNQKFTWWSEKLERLLVSEGVYPNWDTAKQNFEFKTMHKSKGLEAEVVVLLEIESGKFPNYHPNSLLFEVFGDTFKNITDEKRRLFYVALTRAKERVFIITSKDHRSEYLKDLL